MEKVFNEYFAVGRYVILAELQALRTDKLDVNKYVAQFNQVKSKYYWNVGDE